MDWSDELLAAVDLTRAQLPKLVPARRQSIGDVDAGMQRSDTGLEGRNDVVVAGGGDGQCAGTGANVFVTGRAYLNLGTAVVSGSFGKTYAHDPAFRTMTAVAKTGYILRNCHAHRHLSGQLDGRASCSTSKRHKNPRHIARPRSGSGASPIGADGVAAGALLVGLHDALLGPECARRHCRAYRHRIGAAMSIAPSSKAWLSNRR